ncbi:hypothetical protein MTO96_044085 [Rhipicephalus appendiculatus]
MSPKGALYRTAHAYGKRRKPWNKGRKLDTEANATDLANQEKPVQVGDRDSSPMCDCDSASVCTDYDLTVGRVDGACGTEDASSVGDAPTCNAFACCADVSACRADGSACGVDVSASRDAALLRATATWHRQTQMFVRRVFSSGFRIPLSIMKRLRDEKRCERTF